MLAGSGTTIAKPLIPIPEMVGAKLPISVFAPVLRLNEYSEFDPTGPPAVQKYPESPMAAIPPSPPIGGETTEINELTAVDGLMASNEFVTRSSPTSMLSLRQARPLTSWTPPLMIPTVVVAAVSRLILKSAGLSLKFMFVAYAVPSGAITKPPSNTCSGPIEPTSVVLALAGLIRYSKPLPLPLFNGL